MLYLKIGFLDMCFLERLADGLNFQKYFTHFQKYLGEGRRQAAEGGGRRWSDSGRRQWQRVIDGG